MFIFLNNLQVILDERKNTPEVKLLPVNRKSCPLVGRSISNNN